MSSGQSEGSGLGKYFYSFSLPFMEGLSKPFTSISFLFLLHCWLESVDKAMTLSVGWGRLLEAHLLGGIIS